MPIGGVIEIKRENKATAEFTAQLEKLIEDNKEKIEATKGYIQATQTEENKARELGAKIFGIDPSQVDVKLKEGGGFNVTKRPTPETFQYQQTPPTLTPTTKPLIRQPSGSRQSGLRPSIGD